MVLILACGPEPILSIGELTLVSKTRVSRTEFDFVYRAEVTNEGWSALNVTATVTSTAAATQVIDGDLSFGDVPEGATVPSQDTFTIRQDRAVPFDAEALIWEFSFELAPANRPPALDPVPDQEATVGELFSLVLVAQDPDGDALKFTLVSAPEGMVIDAVTGEISWTPAETQVGLHSVTVSVSDGQGGEAEESFEIDVASAGDQVAPMIDLTAPSAAVVSSSVQITAQASDDVAVTKVVFFAGGLRVKELLAEPYQFEFNAPSSVGAVLEVRAVASDAAGNEGEDTARIVAVDSPDEEPPVVEAILLPPVVAPGETFSVRAEVRDDRGVSLVRFLDEGVEVAVDSLPPFQAQLSVPVDASPGDQRRIGVEAEDAAGNPGSGEVLVDVVEAPDTTPPSGVAVVAPDSAVAGQVIGVAASAVDDVGILSVTLRVDGVAIGEDTAPPYEFQHAIRQSRPVGSLVRFTAVATDFSGNTAQSEARFTEIVAPSEGAVVGEVYDDGTGLPLAGVAIRVLAAGGQTLPPGESAALDTVSGEGGSYRVSLPEGQAILQASLDGYTPVTRIVSVLPGEITTSPDARLTPLAVPVLADPLASREVQSEGAAATLLIPAGAFAAPRQASLTSLSGQGLAALLPLGWAPVAAFHVEPALAQPNAPLTLRIPGRTNPRLIGVVWDQELRSWTRVETSLTASGIDVRLPRLGSVALVRGDLQPAAPSVPALGAPLVGVAPSGIAAAVELAITPSPEILFFEPGERSRVSASLVTGGPISSGSRIEVDVLERYERTDGSALLPDLRTQDFSLHQGVSGAAAAFVVGPSQLFDPTLLREGVIGLEAYRVGQDEGASLIGPGGGSVSSPAGLALDVPSGALSQVVPVSLRRPRAADPLLAGAPGLEVLATATVGLGGVELALPGDLVFTLAGPIDPAAQLLVVRNQVVEGATRHVLAGVGAVDGNTVRMEAGGTALPLPGVRTGGVYSLIRLLEPIGFVTGLLESEGGPVPNAIVETPSLPFVGLAGADDSLYTVAATVGATQVDARDLSSGRSAVGEATLGAPGEIAILDLDLSPAGPVVVSLRPEAGASGVPLTSPVTAVFSRRLAPQTVNVDSVRVLAGGASVAGTVSLLADKKTAVFRATAPFADGTEHILEVAATVEDEFGNGLVGNQPDGSFQAAFTTVDTTPPPRPEAGQVAGIFSEAGELTFTGTQGAAEAGAIVTVTNTADNSTASVIAGTDGSFSVGIAAQFSDTVEVVYRDAAGNQTRVDPGPLRSPDGSILVTAAGAMVAGDGDVLMEVAPGALPPGTPVSVAMLEGAVLGPQVADSFELIGAVAVDVGDAIASSELEVSIPAPPELGLTEATQIVVLQEIDFFGATEYTLVNVAALAEGRVATASPPFDGIVETGHYFFAAASVPISFVGVGVAAALDSSFAVLEAAGLRLIADYRRAAEGAARITAHPTAVEFTVTPVTETGAVLTAKPFQLIPSPDLRTLNLGDPATENEAFEVVSSSIANDAKGVSLRTGISIVFNQQIDPGSLDRFRIAAGQAEATGDAFCEGGLKLTKPPGENVPRVLTCIPKRRLRYATQYTIGMDGLCAFETSSTGGNCEKLLSKPASREISFTTFKPFSSATIEREDLFSPKAVTVLDEDLIAVSNGSRISFDPGDGVTLGITLVDVSVQGDPEIVQRLSDPSAGALHALGPNSLLALSGSSQRGSIIRFLEVDRTDVVRFVGGSSQRLTATQDQLLTGQLKDTPPFLGIAKHVAVLGNAAYLATVPPGVQAVDLIKLKAGEKTKDVGLFPFDPAGALLISVETTNDLVFAATMDEILVLGPNLVPRAPPIGGQAFRLAALECLLPNDAEVEQGLDACQHPERFDLLLAMDFDGLLRFIDITNLAAGRAPFERGRVELGTRGIGGIAVDLAERVAYLASSDFLVVDLIDVFKRTPVSGVLDGDGLAGDDRILGRFPEFGGALDLELSPGGGFAYLPITKSLEESRFEIVSVKDPRLFVEAEVAIDEDGDGQADRILETDLAPFDYYPYLGEREIRVRAENPNGTAGTGEVFGQVLSPSGPTLDTDSALLKDGVATFFLDGRTVRNHDCKRKPGREPCYIDLQFQWLRDEQAIESTTATFRIRDNSLTSVQELLSGRAVYVACDVLKTCARSRTVRGAIPGIEDVETKGAAPRSRQRLDVIQEALNQVVPRKRDVIDGEYGTVENDGSIDSFVVGLYRLIEEDGLYGEQTERALGTFKAMFLPNKRVTRRNLSAPSTLDDSTRYLLETYSEPGLRGVNQFIDRETLALEAFSEDHRCFGQMGGAELDALESCGQTNAGLYEVYNNIVRIFIEEKIRHMETYVDLTPRRRDGSITGAPVQISNEPRLWQSRQWAKTKAIVPPPVGTDGLHDGRVGVGYCYGCKQTVEEFAKQVSSLGAPLNISLDYDRTADDRRYTGLRSSEFSVWSRAIDEECTLGDEGRTTYPKGQCPLTTDLRTVVPPKSGQQFSPGNWTGVDCSGLVQHAISHGRRQVAEIADRIVIPVPEPTSEVRGRLLGAKFIVEPDKRFGSGWNPGEPARQWVYPFAVTQPWRRGDLITNEGKHIVTAYEDQLTEGSHVRVIHANGCPRYKRDGREFFGHKVIISLDNGICRFTPAIYGRETLWD